MASGFMFLKAKKAAISASIPNRLTSQVKFCFINSATAGGPPATPTKRAELYIDVIVPLISSQYFR